MALLSNHHIPEWSILLHPPELRRPARLMDSGLCSQYQLLLWMLSNKIVVERRVCWRYKALEVCLHYCWWIQANCLMVWNPEGELIDLIEDFSEGRVQFAFVKVKDPNTTLPKYVLIGWVSHTIKESVKITEGPNITYSAVKVFLKEPKAISQATLQQYPRFFMFVLMYLITSHLFMLIDLSRATMFK